MNRNRIRGRKIAIVGLCLLFSACTGKVQLSASAQNATPPSPVGTAAVKNFDQYYNYLRYATGNYPQTSVTVNGTAAKAFDYYTTAAASVLPLTTVASSTTASAKTYMNLASYFANDFFIGEMALAPAKRLALGPLGTVSNGLVSVPYTAAIAQQIGTNMMSLFLNRTATAADIQAINASYSAVFGSGAKPPTTVGSLANAQTTATVMTHVVILGTALLASPYAAASN